MIYFRIFPQQCGLVVPLPMVIVGRGEEGLQRRQRTSLDRQNSPNSPECAAAADGSTTDANSNATAATAEAEAQSTAHSGSKLPKIRQKFAKLIDCASAYINMKHLVNAVNETTGNGKLIIVVS